MYQNPDIICQILGTDILNSALACIGQITSNEDNKGPPTPLWVSKSPLQQISMFEGQELVPGHKYYYY